MYNKSGCVVSCSYSAKALAVCNACLGAGSMEHKQEASHTTRLISVKVAHTEMESISVGLLMMLPDGWGSHPTSLSICTSVEMASRGEVTCSCQVIHQSIHHISFFLFSLAPLLTFSFPGWLKCSVHNVHFLSLRQVDAK